MHLSCGTESRVHYTEFNMKNLSSIPILSNHFCLGYSGVWLALEIRITCFVGFMEKFFFESHEKSFAVSVIKEILKKNAVLM